MAKVSPPSIYVVPVNPAMLAKAVGLLAGPESAKIVGTQSSNLGVLDPSGAVLKRLGANVIPKQKFIQALKKLKLEMLQRADQIRIAPIRRGGGGEVTDVPALERKIDSLRRDQKRWRELGWTEKEKRAADREIGKVQNELIEARGALLTVGSGGEALRRWGGLLPRSAPSRVSPLYLIATGTYNQAEGLKLVGTHNDVDISSGRAADRLLLGLALKQAPPSSVSIELILPEEETVKGEVMFGSEDRQNLDGLTIPGFPARLSRGLRMATSAMRDPRKQKEILNRLGEGQVIQTLYIPAEAFAGILLTPAGRMEHERLGHREKILDFLVGGPGKLPKGKLERLAEKYDSYPKLFAFLQSPRFEKLLATGSDLRETPVKGWKPLEVDPVALTEMVKSANQGDTFFTLKKYEDDPKSWGKAKGAVLPTEALRRLTSTDERHPKRSYQESEHSSSRATNRARRMATSP